MNSAPARELPERKTYSGRAGTIFSYVQTLSVIIPTLNESPHIGSAVESALSCGATEVIVVDAGSTDDTQRLAEAAGAQLVIASAVTTIIAVMEPERLSSKRRYFKNCIIVGIL